MLWSLSPLRTSVSLAKIIFHIFVLLSLKCKLRAFRACLHISSFSFISSLNYPTIIISSMKSIHRGTNSWIEYVQ